LVLAGSLLFALLPLKEKAQTKPADQSLNSLIGLLLEAESISGTEMMKSQLKEIREAASHASRGNLGRAATATEMLRVRTMLRQIVDNPRGEKRGASGEDCQLAETSGGLFGDGRRQWF
jgi:hypothetical protein